MTFDQRTPGQVNKKTPAVRFTTHGRCPWKSAGYNPGAKVAPSATPA